MGLADIVPGVSGGTVALIVGIYDELLKTLANFKLEFVKLVFKGEWKRLHKELNLSFLVPIGLGVMSAILSMARLMSFLLKEYPEYTWSLFFGLISACVIFLRKKNRDFKDIKNLSAFSVGAMLGLSMVFLIPVHTPDALWFIFFSGCIAITAMILPGVSGSFILLMLGKYALVTGALKNPFMSESIEIIFVFSLGCLVGILSFSRILHYLLERYYSIIISLLTGFIAGSLVKVWPWRVITQTKIIRGKTYIISQENILPNALNSEVAFALICMIFGFYLVFLVEKLSVKSMK